MKPHDVLDFMFDRKGRVTKAYFPYAADTDDPLRFKNTHHALQTWLSRCIHFDFGDIRPGNAHIRFGYDLLEKGLFRLPFDFTSYTYSLPVKPRPDMQVPDFQKAMICLIPDLADDERKRRNDYEMTDLDNYAMLLCQPITDPKYQKELGYIPVAVGNKWEYELLPDGQQVELFCRVTPMCSDTAIDHMYPEPPEVQAHKLRDTLGKHFTTMIGLTAMLMSEGVEKIHKPEPVKLNKKRLAKGRATIGEGYTIKIRTPASYVRSDGKGGTHASPIPHWRRGHFRTIHRGEPNEKTIPIPPMMVAAGGLDDIVPEQTYTVKERSRNDVHSS